MKTFSYFSTLAITVTAILVFGCKDTAKSEAKRTGSDSASIPTTQNRSITKAVNALEDTSRIYRVFAKVTAISKADSTITIDHGKMEGFMDAMEMPYKVADQTIFKEVRVGTKGHFTIKVVNGEGIITSVHVHTK